MEALIVLFATGLISMFIALWKKPVLVISVAAVGLATAIASIIYQLYNPYTWLNYEGLRFDGFSYAYSLLAIVFAFLIILTGYIKFKEEPEHTGEYISLMIFSLCGALCMVSFTDLFMFFIGLEILSIPVYVMAGSRKKDLRSTEASLKYFFTGAFATGILLFGIALLYGAVATFKLDEIYTALTTQHDNPLALIGILMILASFLFKVGAAPFHFWGPDVYEGSPNIVTAYMAAVVKLAAFGAFIHLFTVAFSGMVEFWSPVLFGLSILTMFIGNLTALRQITFKRLIAYSSITHVGYSLMAIMDTSGMSDINLWIYLMAYGFSIIAMITISLILNDDSDLLASYKGFAKRYPFAGFVLILAMLSMAGVPPLAGFFGKYLIFSGLIEEHPVLVIIALINSGIAIYYYLKLIRISLEPSEEHQTKNGVPLLYYIILGICTLGILGGGILTWIF